MLEQEMGLVQVWEWALEPGAGSGAGEGAAVGPGVGASWHWS